MQQLKTIPQIDTAVLFLIFNRLDTTKQVFEAIRQARPRRLYIAADGPRPGCIGDEERVKAVRNYVLEEIDWQCEVKTLFREDNLGCGVAVSNAIDWFFESEETGIILEDDVLPDQSFFPFCEELLNRYRNDSRVMIISGNYLAGEENRPLSSYYFSRYPHTWGWATWRRAWRCNDRQMKKWPHLKETKFLRHIADGDKYFAIYWSTIFDMIYKGRDDIWDYHFIYSSFINGGLSIMPSKNLVKNIGFIDDATHTFDSSHWIAKLPLERMEFSLVHPMKIERNSILDCWSNQHLYEMTFIPSLKLWIKQRPGGNMLANIYRLLKRLLRISKKTENHYLNAK